MLERSILAVHTVDAAGADSAALRDRLKGRFAAGAARRMTLLGMMIGHVLETAAPDPVGALVYSSQFGESLALEKYLESFPSASPTLFQTSIHPSAVQQILIQRGQPVREVIPIAGGPELALHGALAALTNPADDLVWCGGEECGTWLREAGVAADRSFAFALRLRRGPAPGAIGTLRLVRAETTEELALARWCEHLRDRQRWQGSAGTGWQLEIDWA